MNDDVAAALHRTQLIDLTTIGRRTGQPRRIEIYMHDLDGVLFITGIPRADQTRAWIRNIIADPAVVVHLKEDVNIDVAGSARVITDPDERRPFIETAARRWGRDDVDAMMAHSPLIVVDVPASSPAG